MNYSCNICNFDTNNKYVFNRHLNTNKHFEKEKNNNFCNICNKYFNTIKQYNTHKRYHDIKNKKQNNNNNITDKNNLEKTINNIKLEIIDGHNILNNNQKKIFDTQNIIFDKQNIICQNQEQIIETNKEVVTVVNKAITKASSLIKYLMEYHASTPPLRKINCIDFIKQLRLELDCPESKDNNYSLQYKLISLYKTNKFVKNISQLILKVVHYKDYQNQPIYNTDSSRNNYVIKTSSKWNEDKAGIKFTEYVIRPILKYIRNLIEDFRNNDIRKRNLFSVNDPDLEYNTHLYGTVLDFESKLVDEDYTKDILKELSPYLRYLEQEIEELEKYNKLESLQNDLKKIIKTTKNNLNDNSDDNSDDN